MVSNNYPPMALSSSQAKTLEAIFDTVLAQLTPEEEEAIIEKIKGKENIYQVSLEQASAISQLSATSLKIPSIVVDFFSKNVAPAERAGLLRTLDTLATRPGSFLLTGYWKPFTEQSRQQREEIMLKWKNSSLLTLRNLFKTLCKLCLATAYKQTHSPLVDSIGHDAAHGDTFFENHPDYDPVEHERIPMMQTAEATKGNSLEFDVVVVGSGAGGGVAAAELARAGYSVLVIEKGKYYHQSEMVHEEEHCHTNMYDGGAPIASTSGSIHCFSGATLGGGTAVNYLACLKPQHFVRQEWADQGLSYFTSPQFSKDLDRVFDRIGASQENILQTKTNTGIKNSSANTWLLDALHHGARFLDRTLVTRIVTSNAVHGIKALGVECEVHDLQQSGVIMVKAKKVIVACGALRTPSLLQASGLRNKNIGRHLRLHPILFGLGFFDETIRQNDGPLMSRVCNVSDNCQGDNYGAKIEEVGMLPGALAGSIPWLGAAKHKELMLRHKSVIAFLNVARDKDSIGVVRFEKSASTNPVYEYALSKHDAKSLAISIERNMRILAAAGARELYTSQANVEGFAFNQDEISSADNPRFNRWLDKVRNAGISAVSTPLVSAHQLGSCRMGISPKTSAVQPTGETWECSNIYVADGSVFPTAVGVNPMVTIEAIALHVSRNVISTMEPPASRFFGINPDINATPNIEDFSPPIVSNNEPISLDPLFLQQQEPFNFAANTTTVLDENEQKAFSSFLDAFFLDPDMQPGLNDDDDECTNSQEREEEIRRNSILQSLDEQKKFHQTLNLMASLSPTNRGTTNTADLMIDSTTSFNKINKDIVTSKSDDDAAVRKQLETIHLQPSDATSSSLFSFYSRQQSAKKRASPSMDSASPSSSSASSRSTRKSKKPRSTKELLTEEEKRANHIASEQKRRSTIRNGFKDLTDLIPTLKNINNSKSAVLFKAVDFIRYLEKRNKHLRDKVGSLELRVKVEGRMPSSNYTQQQEAPTPPSSSSQPQYHQSDAFYPTTITKHISYSPPHTPPPSQINLINTSTQFVKPLSLPASIKDNNSSNSNVIVSNPNDSNTGNVTTSSNDNHLMKGLPENARNALLAHKTQQKQLLLLQEQLQMHQRLIAQQQEMKEKSLNKHRLQQASSRHTSTNKIKLPPILGQYDSSSLQSSLLKELEDKAISAP
ncbi:hypothetical protein [Parasitella parasitica]|uniref:BHLH domain-containing protein n=1 Tax=Parasitella parasitica TaxID=35722 RepID=A0A0B7N706_9FUNG|nr:hypothetical protein [Parasitella parasitica]